MVAGSPGKSGAAAMAGVAALRTGAGLVTVASSGPVLEGVSAMRRSRRRSRKSPGLKWRTWR